MLITESQMGYGYGGSTNALRLLDNMYYLSEEESRYSPAMVPIVENTQVGANLIRLEDLLAFGESNGINDLGYALQLVCETSNVSPNTIALTVQEDTVCADPDVASLVSGIMNEGVRIAAVPMRYCTEAWVVDKAVTSLINNWDSTMLDAVVNEDYRTFLEAEAESGTTKAETGTGEQPKADEAAPDDKGKDVKKDEKEADGLMDKLKKNINKGRAWFARIALRINQWAMRVNEKIKEEVAKNNDKKASLWQKIKSKLLQALSWISEKFAGLAIGDKFKDTSVAGEGNFQSKDYKFGDKAATGTYDSYLQQSKNYKWGFDNK